MLRLALAASTIVRAAVIGSTETGGMALAIALLTGLGGVVVAVGLMTPLAGVTVAILASATAVGVPIASPATSGTALLVAADAIAIALLGPGAYSIDARLFGRREIVVSQAPRR